MISFQTGEFIAEKQPTAKAWFDPNVLIRMCAFDKDGNSLTTDLRGVVRYHIINYLTKEVLQEIILPN